MCVEPEDGILRNAPDQSDQGFSILNIVSANNPTPKPSMNLFTAHGPLATPTSKFAQCAALPSFYEILKRPARRHDCISDVYSRCPLATLR